MKVKEVIEALSAANPERDIRFIVVIDPPIDEEFSERIIPILEENHPTTAFVLPLGARKILPDNIAKFFTK